MTRRAGHLAGERAVASIDEASEPRLDSADPGLDLSVGRVEAWGGDIALYRAFLARAVTLARALTAESDPSSEGAGGTGRLTLAALAAWRSGVLGLRGDCLRRLEAVVAAQPDSPRRASAAAALGLRPEALDAFVSAQRGSCFGGIELVTAGLRQPESDAAASDATGVVSDGADRTAPDRVVLARIGGFRGLGGPWQQPPSNVREMAGEGRFVVTSGDDRWLVEADVFGSRLSRLAEGEDPALSEHDGSGGPRTRLVTSRRSYFAYLVVEAGS